MDSAHLVGLLPDFPSEEGIINRVVERFPLHAPS